MKRAKVFCLGFHKTGTSSVGLALERLGYDVTGFDPFRELAERDELTLEEVEDVALEVAQRFDAAQDSPWPILYRQLDRAFPGSRFIHVQRDRNAWIASAVRDFGEWPNELRRLIYGTPYPKGNEEAWLARYDAHNREVREYFADRPDDFITLDLEAGEVNWENVCMFLGEPIPDAPWPHANRARVKALKMRYWKLRDRMRRRGLRAGT